MKYNLELDKVIAEIRKDDARTVGIQLADGLKPRVEEIQKEIREVDKKIRELEQQKRVL